MASAPRSKGRSKGRTGRPWRRLRESVRRRRDPCHLCGHPIDYTLDWPDPKSFTVDHIIPLTHAPDLARDRNNTAAAHLDCNSSKGAGGRPSTPHSETW